jgi:thiamine-phosphate pyrophosphorylase
VNRTSALRLVDANANRALEGLRVCEDIVRFHCASPRHYRRLRALRHGIAGAVRGLPVTPAQLARARESGRDVGRRSPSARVATLERLLLINLQRAKEALRTLEETSRLLSPPQAAIFQRLRFRTYDVERDLLLALDAVRHH